MNLNELKKLAEAATPGPWSNRELKNMEDCILSPDGETWVLYNDEINTMKQEDSDFVTAANPQMIQRMIGCMEVMATALESTETEMRYAGFSQYQSDNAMRKQAHEEAVKALAAFNELNSEV